MHCCISAELLHFPLESPFNGGFSGVTPRFAGPARRMFHLRPAI
jgi:hypothetical protein